MMKKRNYQGWLAAVALGAGISFAPAVFAQDAGLTRQQQLKQEADQKRERRNENNTDKQLSKQERRAQKREREELNNMPKPVRQTLRAETANAKNVDFYRVQGAGGKGEAGREFGAKFTAANGHQMDIRVDREGKVIDRDDLTATASAAQTPATAAQQPAPATPTTPAPTPAKPGSPTASTQAPESGNPIYRRLQANEVPANIRAQFDKDTTNAKDVRYYRTKYGNELAYEAKWQDPKTGKDMRHYVSDAGQTLVRGESIDDDNERLASASDRRHNEGNRDNDRRDANRDRDRDHHDDNATTAGSSSKATIKTGRAELNDLPKPVQTYFRRSTENAKDVKFYNTKYGNQQAYQADFTASDGKQHTVILDSSGKVLSDKTDNKK